MNLKLHLARTDGAGKSAFTRLELLAVIVTLVLVAGVVIPAFAQSKPRSQQVICLNNLRMIGQAVLLFNAENGQMDPWRAPGAGYQHPSGLGNNAWFQFQFLSNGLSNPKVLVCPSDIKRPAKNYSLSPDGGFFHPSYQNNAISYFAGLDSSPLLPGSVLSGDRNIQNQGTGPCSSGITVAATIRTRVVFTSWLRGIHGTTGNILLHDGHVEQTTSQTLPGLFNDDDDNGSVHLLLSSPMF